MKVVQPNLPSGHTIFCDDIRQEITGKLSFIGAYAMDLYVGEFPAHIPKFCFMIIYRDEVTSKSDVFIRGFFEPTDGEEALLFEMRIEIPQDKVKAKKPKGFVMREYRASSEMSPLIIPGPGQLKVRAYRDDLEVRIGALRISMHPDLIEDAD